MRLTEYDHVVQAFPADRANEPLSICILPGDRNAIGRSRMPMAHRRCTKTDPYEVSRSRMRYRGAWSHGKASVIWREIHSAVGFSVTPNDSQIRRPCPIEYSVHTGGSTRRREPEIPRTKKPFLTFINCYSRAICALLRVACSLCGGASSSACR